MEFKPMPKTPRLSREVVITEKIDGTNASVYVGAGDAPLGAAAQVGEQWIVAGSRTRWICPSDDNFGFARWVQENAEALALLGPGHHFGEWWGKGIQRGYGLEERRFSLFNVGRWWDWHIAGHAPADLEIAPSCCYVVPVLSRGSLFDMQTAEWALNLLRDQGSAAAPGFMDPEGIMVYHTAAGQLFKKTLKGDAEGKHAEAHPPKVRAPKAPRDPNVGGRRRANVGAPDGIERRRA
jgi:hypothetical protein